MAVVPIAPNLDVDTYPSFVVWRDWLYLVNGTNTGRVGYEEAIVHSWLYQDKADWTDVVGDPIANLPEDGFKLIEAFVGRLWLTGQAEHRCRLDYSDPAEPNFPAENRIVLKQDSGQITAMKVWNRTLWIFKEETIIALPYTELPKNYAFHNLRTGYGCVAPYSIAKTREGLLWLAEDGVRVGAPPNAVNISDKRVSSILDDINPEWLRNSYGFYNPVKYKYHLLLYTNVPYDGYKYPNVELVYNLQKRRWRQVERQPRLGVGGVVDESSERRVYMGSRLGRQYRIDSGIPEAAASISSGTITSHSTTTSITDAAAAFPDSGEELKQAPVTVCHNNSIFDAERRIVESNTATQLTFETALDTEPTDDIDTYTVGGVEAEYETDWFCLGMPYMRKRIVDMEVVFEEAADDNLTKIGLALQIDYNSAGELQEEKIITGLRMDFRNVSGVGVWFKVRIVYEARAAVMLKLKEIVINYELLGELKDSG